MNHFKPFSALVLSDLRARQVLGDTAPTSTSRKKGEYTEVYRCDNCSDIHDDEGDAEDCCAEDVLEARLNDNCPACGKEASDFREAADCCLWKDLDAPKRWAIADAVEAGATWQEAIEQHTGQAIN